MTNRRSIILALSSTKGRHGNNLLHIMNLFSYSECGIFILDRSYRQTINFSRLIVGNRSFIFIPFLDRSITYLSHIRFYVGKYLGFKRIKKCFPPRVFEKKVYKFEISFAMGELLTNYFRPDLYHRILACLPKDREFLGAGTNKYACHMRFGDFSTHRDGFLLYNADEVIDIIGLSSSIVGTVIPSSLASIYTDDEEAASEALGFKIQSKEQSVKQDWLDISQSNIIITNGSTFAISAFMLSVQAEILVMPQRIYKMYIEEHDILFTWMEVLECYGSLILLRKPHKDIKNITQGLGYDVP